MTNTINLLNGIEALYPENNAVAQIKRTLQKFPETEDTLVDAYSLGQIKSKLWLIENLPNELGTVFICGGWYGTLASLMFERCREKFDTIRSFDLDPSCAPVADNINKPHVMDGWQFKASTMDIHDMEYPCFYTTFRADGTSVSITEMPDTIINTSCEHIENFSEWFDKIPKGKLICLQSNDYVALEEHVNCVKDNLHFAEIAPLSKVLFTGSLSLTKYNRYMRIGYK